MARLAEAMNGNGIRSRIFAPMNRWPHAELGAEIVNSESKISKIISKMPYKYARSLLVRNASRQMLNTAIRAKLDGERSISYLWGEIPLRFAYRLKEEGILVLREKTNCAKLTSRKTLDLEYAKLGLTPSHNISDRLIEKEMAELPLADAIFCPSPMVAETLAKSGVDPARFLMTSYGWDPKRFEGKARLLEPSDGPTLAFVGTICVRKGAHILLEAWRRANIKGRLVLAGEMEPAIGALYADVLARDDVHVLPFTHDMGAVYRSADWFIFPTLEEGGPQVTYEAAGNGLPAIVSRMGAGAFTEAGQHGLIVESDDANVWAEVIASLPGREEERRLLAKNARAHAQHFTWDKVGARRRAQVKAFFGS
jgi:glycosyltransferase involved in cell wall biosynthesis